MALRAIVCCSVIAACAVFQKGFQESKEASVPIKGVDADQFRLLLEFICERQSCRPKISLLLCVCTPPWNTRSPTDGSLPFIQSDAAVVVLLPSVVAAQTDLLFGAFSTPSLALLTYLVPCSVAFWLCVRVGCTS